MTDRQRKAIYALVSGDTITDAADKAGVSRKTVHTWLEEPGFLGELERLRALREEVVLETLQAATGAAARRLLNLVQDPHTQPDDFLRAAGVLFRRLPEPPARETEDQITREVLRELQALLPEVLWAEVVTHLQGKRTPRDLVSQFDLREAFDGESPAGKRMEGESVRALEWATAEPVTEGNGR